MNLKELKAIAPALGEAFALRGCMGDHEYLLTGTIAAVNLEATLADGDCVIEFDVDGFHYLSPNTDTGDVGGEWVTDPEPSQMYLRDDPRPAPLPALKYREALPLGVALPSPIFRGTRVAYYDTRPQGTPLAFITGQLVDPRDVLTEEIEL